MAEPEDLEESQLFNRILGKAIGFFLREKEGIYIEMPQGQGNYIVENSDEMIRITITEDDDFFDDDGNDVTPADGQRIWVHPPKEDDETIS